MPGAFQDPCVTLSGERRASVDLRELRTLWFHTGSRCNLACATCYVESGPHNDTLDFLALSDVEPFLDEIESGGWGTREIGFTGGEPFVNPHLIPVLDACLARGHAVLVLTNAGRPMLGRRRGLLELRERYGDRLSLRVSLDHYGPERHERERGPGSWDSALRGVAWLADSGFPVAVAGRTCWEEGEPELRAGYAKLFDRLGLRLDALDPACLVLFPDLEGPAPVPEITESCWGVLGVSPDDMMCAHSRMVVRRKGEAAARVVACTLLPYAPRFELGGTLAESARTVSLNHPRCARFCVLGGGHCSPA
jgi:uncharacterized Fe-S cluster-containing radical SAM superfamily protein